MKCPSCGEELKEGAKFCTKGCGNIAELAAKAEAEKPAGGAKCPGCGTETAAGTKFCPECGGKLGGPPKCPGCGAEAAEGVKFCAECGAKLGGQPVNAGGAASAGDSAKPKVGGTMSFGGYEWLVLDVQGDKALLLMKNDGEEGEEGYCRYHDVDTIYADNCEEDCDNCTEGCQHPEATWETCTLRQHLNTEFLGKFSDEERKRIIVTKNRNPDNLWYGTPGGGDTDDKVFLLSLEEADKYFGDSGDYINKKRSGYDFKTGTHNFAEDGDDLSNAYDDARNEGHFSSWWLRSPGSDKSQAASVYGPISVSGTFVNLATIVARPALWLKL